MSQEADFTRAVVDVRNELAKVFNEGLETHGPAIVMSALSMFAATAVHQAEHFSSDPQSRNIVLGQWLTHFHAYLAHVNMECDDQQSFMKQPPEGQA
jgi:hypothetical protein